MLRPKLRRLSTDSADLSDYELARSRRASLTAEQRRKLSMLRTSSTPQPLSPVSHIYHLVPCPRQCCHQSDETIDEIKAAFSSCSHSQAFVFNF
ncbi:unnamed protein product, partial [Iphiclides podalirius]